MKLVRGIDLTEAQRHHVLSAFLDRWTSDNRCRAYVWAPIKDKPTAPLVTDEQWLADHAFYIASNGQLSRHKHHHHAEPACMAGTEVPGFAVKEWSMQ